MSFTRKQNVRAAKACVELDRFVHAVEPMKNVVETGVELTQEERNIICVGAKNVIDPEKARWAMTIFNRHHTDEEKLAGEREGISIRIRHVLKLLDTFLVPKDGSPGTKVFLFKMKGDYYRYLAEISVGEEKTVVAGKSGKCYQDGFDIAKESLPPPHPIRLGLTLNFSVFYYEIMNAKDKACLMTKTALSEASGDLDKEYILIRMLLRDNLNIWKTRNYLDDVSVAEPGPSN